MIGSNKNILGSQYYINYHNAMDNLDIADDN